MSRADVAGLLPARAKPNRELVCCPPNLPGQRIGQATHEAHDRLPATAPQVVNSESGDEPDECATSDVAGVVEADEHPRDADHGRDRKEGDTKSPAASPPYEEHRERNREGRDGMIAWERRLT